MASFVPSMRFIRLLPFFLAFSPGAAFSETISAETVSTETVSTETVSTETVSADAIQARTKPGRTAQPYRTDEPPRSSARASMKTSPNTKELSSEEKVINGLTLIDAERDQPIQPLRDGDEINLANLPSRSVNIRVDTDVAVTRVVFGLDHHSRYREEIARPYSLAGDRDGDYAGWTPNVGEHQLTITPYSRGRAKKPLQLSFTVIDQ